MVIFIHTVRLKTDIMKTKILCLLFAVFFGFLIHSSAQTTKYVTLTPDINNLPVQTNQLISVIGYDWFNTPSISGVLPSGTQLNLTPFRILSGGAGIVTSSQIPQIATGMTNVAISSGGGWATFKIETPATASVISNYVPADAIVIPASATGSAQIILESSPDLVNWTAANPGTYGASAGTNRFFRVRAAMNP